MSRFATLQDAWAAGTKIEQAGIPKTEYKEHEFDGPDGKIEKNYSGYAHLVDARSGNMVVREFFATDDAATVAKEMKAEMKKRVTATNKRRSGERSVNAE